MKPQSAFVCVAAAAVATADLGAQRSTAILSSATARPRALNTSPALEMERASKLEESHPQLSLSVKHWTLVALHLNTPSRPSQ